jgi:mannose-6-phosphate isomerase-like protein (cupin superfamily)
MFLETVVVDGQEVRRFQHLAPNADSGKEHGNLFVVMRGVARLRFKGEAPVEMNPGDFINIPAHKKHRVEWTTPGEPTVWLAVYYGDQK